jgi:CRP-like cAMP-binding protein
MADVGEIGLTLDDIIEHSADPKWGAGLLRDIFLFEKFTDDELVEMYKIGLKRKVKKNNHIIVEGEPTRGMYILLFGKVSVYKADSSTNSLIRLAILEAGSNFGELSLFDEAPRSATVAAENNCFIFQLDAEEFAKFLDEQGEDLKVRFYQTCAEELARRFRVLNGDYISSQQLLWKHALRRKDEGEKSGSAQEEQQAS